VENDTEFSMNTCVHSSLFFPVAEDGREMFFEFVHNHWDKEGRSRPRDTTS